MGWSRYRHGFVCWGDVLIVVGLTLAMLVIVQNGYAAGGATSRWRRPTLASTGLYKLCAPMYARTYPDGVHALALCSYWGLVGSSPASWCWCSGSSTRRSC